MGLYDRCVDIVEVDFNRNENMLLDKDASALTGFTMHRGLKIRGEIELQRVSKYVYYISDIHLEYRIIDRFKNNVTDENIEKYVRTISKQLITNEIKEKRFLYDKPIILFGGDVAADFELAKIFYSEFVKQWKKINGNLDLRSHLFVIVGNHELWGFKSKDECYKAYREFLNSLNVSFMENTISYLGNFRFPEKYVYNQKKREWEVIEVKKEDGEYELLNRKINNVMIVGGTGFAGYNQEFNADSGIYRGVLNRKQEMEETCRWEKTYNNALREAKSNNSLLVVLTHNPICDWKKYGEYDSGCVYFNGHNHRNSVYHDEEKDIHVFSNNQIGYYNNNIKLKEACIYKRRNPFASYGEGYYEISSKEYLEFYDYIGENVAGTGLIDKTIETQDAIFYMVKHEGYYGFFVLSCKNTYICAGGCIKKLERFIDIEQIDKDFLFMVKKYLYLLSPYRGLQEKISEVVKAFGGEGTIHGLIVDIDFYSHIMLNPNGNLTYYYSPMFGEVRTYRSIISLLRAHNRALVRECEKQLNLPDCPTILTSQTDNKARTTKVDVKNSLYAVSRKMNQLQRLFDNRVLRDWNEAILLIDINNDTKMLP